MSFSSGAQDNVDAPMSRLNKVQLFCAELPSIVSVDADVSIFVC